MKNASRSYIVDFEWRSTDLSLENMEWWLKNALQGGGGCGCQQDYFLIFQSRFFIVTLLHLTSPLFMGYNFAKCPKDTKWLFGNGLIEITWLNAHLMHFTASQV